RGSGYAAVGRLGDGRSGTGELSFPGVEEAVGKLLSETSMRSGGELLCGFFELGAEGLEYHKFGIVLLYAFAREIIG
ncbi:hypothetical protein FocTR4_00017120, partial [Fusarium oxysporum f. sp. cubense]